LSFSLIPARALGVAADGTVHDGIDDADFMAGVVGSASASSRDDQVMSSLTDAGLNASYASLENAADPDEAGRKAVRDFAHRQVSVIVVLGLSARSDEGGWDDALSIARRADVPVVLVDPSSLPKDPVLYACVLRVVSSGFSDTLADAVRDAANSRSPGGVIDVTEGTA
uniref:hypothetical protein n=1 Tax=uncultured Bifidobacterium sp. TaxID=165187 RepID=UPI0028DC2BED